MSEKDLVAVLVLDRLPRGIPTQGLLDTYWCKELSDYILSMFLNLKLEEEYMIERVKEVTKNIWQEWMRLEMTKALIEILKNVEASNSGMYL